MDDWGCGGSGGGSGGESQESVLELSDTSVFDKEIKLKFFLNAELSPALVFMSDEVKAGNIIFELEDGAVVTLLLVRSNTKTKLSLEDDLPVYNIYIDMRCDITEYESKDFSTLTQETILTIRDAAQKTAQQKLKDVIKACAGDNACDVFGFGRKLWLAEPEYYRQNLERWEEILPEIKTQINVRCTIRRIGEEAYFENSKQS